MTRASRVGLAAIVLGVVAAGLLHQQRSAPPIFDGIILPEAPYNYGKAAQPGTISYPVTNGQVGGGGFQTGDNQVVMYFAPGVLTPPPGAQTMDCTITPVTSAPPAPRGAEIRGNVYLIRCVGQPGGGQVAVTGTYHLTMRFPPGGFKEVQFNDGQTWHPLTTLRSPAGDPYASVNAAAFGEFAATAPPGSGGDSILTILGRYIEFYGILGFVIVFGVIAVIQEVRRRRKQS
jgi:hypothetical protein